MVRPFWALLILLMAILSAGFPLLPFNWRRGRGSDLAGRSALIVKVALHGIYRILRIHEERVQK
jgi:hypothetical protein